jgi:hypothetical protein
MSASLAASVERFNFGNDANLARFRRALKMPFPQSVKGLSAMGLLSAAVL